MEAGPHHEIADLRCEPGELSFTARIGEVEQRVQLRTDSDLIPTAEAALSICLLPAMRFGGTLEVPASLSPRLLRNQREFQAVQQAWSGGWEFEDFRLREVEVRAAARPAEAPRPNGRVAAFFSGGVDSWATVLDEPGITDLVFVRGIDLIPRIPGSMEVADEVEERLRAAAGELGHDFHVVETNLRELSDRIAPWETYFGCAAVSVALFLAPLFERVAIAGDSDYEVQVDSGANRMVDQLWSTEAVEIVDAGSRYNRVQRLARICDHPAVQATLRTCWENPDGTYNCGRCRKCLLTMVALEALGTRERISTYPAELDLDAVAALTVERPVSLCFWEDVLDATRAANRPDLERAVEQVVARGKRALGLPPSYRRRALPGPPPTARSAAIASSTSPVELPAFFVEPETAAAIAAAPAVAVLVGSYDGSGNYGDIAQLDATLGMLRRHDPDLLPLPVLERGHFGAHRELRGDFLRSPEHALFFGPGEDHEDDLVPVPAPARAGFAACLLYGGGYLNPSWGSRKLAMLGAAEELLAGAPATPRRLSSGLQVDRGWIAELGAEGTCALRRFELLGARDGGSVEALAALGAEAPILDTGDDAVGVLRDIPLPPVEEAGATLCVNVHVAEHEWVTGRPDGIAPYVAALLAELGRRLQRPVVAQPLIAYLDGRVDERPGVERLGEECAGRGIELDEARVLRPASLAEAATAIRRAPLTVSCSYHVALTSLMLGVPAALIAENEYYRQKAAGLGEPFGLPPELTLDPGEDAAAAAARLAEAALDPPADAEMARRLTAGGERLRERRVAAEEELLARLAHAPASQEHEVTDVEHRDGELSFLARIGGREQRVSMRAEGGETSAEAVLPACVMPAMRFGGRLTLPVAVSPRVLRTQREFQAVQAAWSRGWEFGDPPLAEVEVVAPTLPPEPRPEAEGRVAAFFSGGVDSWSTVLDEPDLTDLIFVRGVDLMYAERRYADLADEVEDRLRGVATELGLGFHPVETNLRDLSDPDIRWEAFFGCALDAVAHFVAPRFERVLLSGDSDHEAQAPIGASRLVDQLWSSERLELVQVGGRHSRIERTRRIADNPLVQRTLRVCWENHDGAYNCGRCRKCIFTMVTLEALGMRESVETFPADLDLDLLDETEIAQHIQLTLWEDVLDAIRATGRIDLAPPVARLVAGGKRNLGLPLSHRGRATPGPPPLRGYAGAGPAPTAAPDRR